jgi:transcriptional regulator with GAF, ATPase, and Fis domain
MKVDQPDIETADINLIHEISSYIHATLDMEEMLHRIFDRLKTVFDMEGASIALHDPEKREFFFIHTAEMDMNTGANGPVQMRFSDDLGIAGWVRRIDRMAVIADVTKEKHFFKEIDLHQQFATRNMVCLPLRTRRGIIGVLYALNKREGSFTEKEAWMLESLSVTIAVAIENARLYGELKDQASTLEQENLRLKMEHERRYNLQGIIGSSLAMQRVFHLIDKILETQTTVLLLGETGTGKELFARLIHYNGPRKNKPFIVENCAALSENLLESELFGHVKGAFTGATADKKGLFEMAQGGSVFLDEIGEIPPGVQVKLLRVLQDGNVRPVGGTRSVTVDFRLISATNRKLDEDVAAGRFREDLLYRIDVFPVTLPPLRERPEDIPSLTDHFLKKHSTKLNRSVESIDPMALELLQCYRWPGNVRELENEIERAVTLAVPEKSVSDKHLSGKITANDNSRRPPKAASETLGDYIERVEIKWIEDTLRENQSNRTHTAKKLGLTRQGLIKKIARYGIDL